jgi:predicted dienelactone hydrolase
MQYALILFLLFFTVPAMAQENTPSQTVTQQKGAPPPEARAYTGNIKPSQPKKVGQKRVRQPNVEIWLPPEFQSSEQKWPLLIFSHGFGGCAKQSVFLTQYLADQGYIVIAPDHEDANCDRFAQGGLRSTLQAMRPGKSMRPEKPFRTPEVWTDKTEADRRDDILFALSSMLDDRQYKNYVDTDKIGLIGHSLGGYTALGLAGAWPSWKDKRFKAVLALSPYADPYMLGHTLGKIDVPVMYQGGTKDVEITPNVRKRGYPQTHAPKYFIEYEGAGHFAWTELDKDYQSIINKTALQFFDKYLKDGKMEILPEGADKPGKPVNKVKTFLKDEVKA